MKLMRLLFVMVVLAVVVIGVVEPRALQALPAPPTCNALYFKTCTNIDAIVNCKWSDGETGACRCIWFVQEPYGVWNKVWDCYLT